MPLTSRKFPREGVHLINNAMKINQQMFVAEIVDWKYVKQSQSMQHF